MSLPTKGLAFSRTADGTVGVASHPGVPTIVPEETELLRDWLAELDLPKDWPQLEALAQPRGLSRRRLRFIIADEGPTLFPGGRRLQPKRHLFYPHGQVFALAHLGFAIGQMTAVWLAEPKDLEGIEYERSALLGEAVLYDSRLAERAWKGIEEGIFAHVCGTSKIMTLTQRSGAVWQKDLLLEVALIDRPACQNAKILKAWEA